ncbi:MAG: DUF2958 domain-containing protein [Candidatus Omnitrophota bacterium]|nr:DUF2958 domain-containing protein [Candidatus Omnitrophota bacterium]
MQLMTKELEKKFADVGRQEGNADPLIVAKFFDPTGSWTWYATEYEPETRTFFGLVDGFEQEWGYFLLDELEECKGHLGLGIERDLHCGYKTLSEWRATGRLKNR